MLGTGRGYSAWKCKEVHFLHPPVRGRGMLVWFTTELQGEKSLSGATDGALMRFPVQIALFSAAA